MNEEKGIRVSLVDKGVAMDAMQAKLNELLDPIEDIPYAHLLGYNEMLWAAQQDIQHEWARRKMSEEGSA